ncbi:hypothetical protein GSG68_18700 [Escherichia coli]|nr:hypothetical protein [Escherichia coli]EFH2892469.1 hypothetical protein [Escherichia coli]EFH5845190.1 hypothetical protein [Escherichia coli]EKR5397503.1 hypothetical protein [Escherichia coli]
MKKILLMLSLLFFTTAGFSEVSDTLVTGGYDKQAMSDAIKHARKETDKFIEVMGNDSNLLIVFYVQIMPDDFVMQLHRF